MIARRLIFLRILRIFKQLVIIFFLTLLCVEIILRSLNWHYVYEQNQANKIYPEDSQKLRILTIGESTTADSNAFPDLAWPRQLESLLNSKGISARVYNIANVATSSSRILSNLENELELYKPDIVISMMGINDSLKFFLARDTFLSKFKIYNLYKWVYRSYLERFYEQPLKLALFEDTNLGKETLLKLKNSQTLQKLKENKTEEAYSLMETQLSGLNNQEKALALSLWAFKELMPTRGEASTDNSIFFKVLNWSFNFHFVVDYSIEEAMFIAANSPGFHKYCIKTANRYFFKYPIMSDFLFLTMQGCAQKAKPEDFEKWKEILSKNNQLNGSFVMTNEGESPINYRKLFDLLKVRNIKWIAMQYPNLSIAQIENYFTSEQRSEMLFVENKENFEMALKTKTWEQVFKDKFAYKFGHTTSYGHALIAEAIAKTLTSSDWLSKINK